MKTAQGNGNAASGANDYLARLRAGQKLSPAQLCAMIVRLSLPAIMGQISMIIMQYIDASMVGSLGAGGSAAIGLVSSTTWLFGGLAMAVGMGFSVQCAQRTGAGDLDQARNLVQTGMLFTLVFSLLIGCAGMTLARYLPVWLGGDPAICRDASSYFFIYAFFFTVERVNFTAGTFLQASGNMRTPGILHVMMCVLDVFFNALLIFPGMDLPGGIRLPGLGLGVAGAALGTGLAKLCSMVLMLYWLYRRPGVLRMQERKRLRIQADQLRRAVKIALPVAVENIIMNSAQITSTRIVAPLGTVSVAANSLSITAESLCYMPGFGISAAGTTIIGQCIGARRKDLTRRTGWLVTGLGIAFMTGMGILLYIFAPYMLSFLSPDPDVIALGTKVLRIEAFAEPMYAAALASGGVMRGGGDTAVPAMLSLFSMWVIRIPLAVFLAPRMGLPGVWLAMRTELWIRGILYLLRQAQGKYAGTG